MSISGGIPYGTSYRINEGGTEQLLMNAKLNILSSNKSRFVVFFLMERYVSSE